MFNILNVAISFIVIAVLFGVIFKVLPDANIKWRDVRSGAIFTAVLFMIGRLVIGIYISNTSSSYGAAGSLIVILLWIYYTAAILYFGAEFTRAYADFYGIRIEPAEFAVHIEQKEEVKDVKVVPPKHEIGESKDELRHLNHEKNVHLPGNPDIRIRHINTGCYARLFR